MEIQRRKEFFTISRLEKIPYLFHGFGAVDWKEEDFRKRPKWRDFKFLFLRQIHSNIVHIIDKMPLKFLRGDALVTAIPNLMLIIKTADCLPVLIVEKKSRVIGAVHCGWRGIQKKVIERAVLKMEEYYGLKSSSLLVAMGPCIGPDCYEVGGDVRQKFEKEGLPLDVFRHHSLHKNKYFLDLRNSSLYQLLSLGVKRENIFIIDFCNHCSKILPSFRRDGKKAMRMLSFIGMSF